jgi:hypothetical protein
LSQSSLAVDDIALRPVSTNDNVLRVKVTLGSTLSSRKSTKKLQGFTAQNRETLQSNNRCRSKIDSAQADADLLKHDPSAVAPIATPFVLAPPEFIVLAPSPVIRMNYKPEFRAKHIPLLDMPAITLGVANDVG